MKELISYLISDISNENKGNSKDNSDNKHSNENNTRSGNLRKLQSSIQQKLRFNNYPSTDELKVAERIEGLIEKLEIHRQYKKARLLNEIFEEIKYQQELQKSSSFTLPLVQVVDFFLELACSPIHSLNYENIPEENFSHLQFLRRNKEKQKKLEESLKREIKQEFNTINRCYDKMTRNTLVAEVSEDEYSVSSSSSTFSGDDDDDDSTKNNSFTLNEEYHDTNVQNIQSTDLEQENTLHEDRSQHRQKPYWYAPKETTYFTDFKTNDPSSLGPALRYHGLFSGKSPQVFNSGHYISEMNFIRETIFFLKGFPTLIYQLETKNKGDPFHVEIKVSLEMSLKHLSLGSLSNWADQQILKLAEKLTLLRRFCSEESLFPRTKTCILFQNSIREFLFSIDKKLTDIEIGYQQEHIKQSTLLDFSSRILKMRETVNYIFPPIFEICSSVSTSNCPNSKISTVILDTLTNYLFETHNLHTCDSESLQILGEMLVNTSTFYCSSVQKWIMTGVIEDKFEETFLSSISPTHDGSHHLELLLSLPQQSSNLPFFLQKVAQIIYDVGHLQRLLSQFNFHLESNSKDHQDNAMPTTMLKTLFGKEDKDTLLPLPRKLALIQHEFSDIALMMISKQFSPFIQTFKGGIGQYFEIMQSLFFMLNGEIMSNAIQQLFEKIMQGPVSDAKLNGIIGEALENMGFVYFLNQKRSSIKFETKFDKSIPYSPIQWINSIHVCMQIPWPFDQVILEEHVTIYCHLFRHLLKIKLVKRLLEIDCFPPRPMDGRKLGRTKGLSVNSGKYTQRSALRMNMLQFVCALENHLQAHVIILECNDFNLNWKNRGDLRSLVAYHQSFIEKIRDKSFLNEKAKLLYNCIEKMFLMIHEFRDFCVTMDEAEIKASSILATPRRRGLAKLASEPDIRSTVTLSKFWESSSSLSIQKEIPQCTFLSDAHSSENDPAEILMRKWLDFNERFTNMKRFLADTYEELASRGGFEHYGCPISSLVLESNRTLVMVRL